MNNIIAFEWQHRCWKWVQIENISKRLKDYWFDVYINRWAFYRKWEWDINSLEDPFSKWWQENRNREWIRDIKHEKMQIELISLMKKINKKHHNKKAFSILDRSIFSFAVWKFIEYKKWNIDFKTFENIIHNMMKVDNKNFYDKKEEIVIPDITFFLKSNKESLINRMSIEDYKSIHKKELIMNFTDAYEETIKHMPNSIRKNIITINWNNEISYISEEIKEILKQKFNL